MGANMLKEFIKDINNKEHIQECDVNTITNEELNECELKNNDSENLTELLSPISEQYKELLQSEACANDPELFESIMKLYKDFQEIELLANNIDTLDEKY